MKTLYIIGREADCDIVLWNDSAEISRHHAQIRIDKKSKYWLMDTSLNGTYLNGMRLQSNQEVMVTRKDVITFAQQDRLDWNLIPKQSKKGLWITLSVLAALLITVCVFATLYWPKDDTIVKPQSEITDQPLNVVDSVCSSDRINMDKSTPTPKVKKQDTDPKNPSPVKTKKKKNKSAEDVYKYFDSKKSSKSGKSSSQAAAPTTEQAAPKSEKSINDKPQTEQPITDPIF